MTTSSAVVGSSAITSEGLQARARAIIEMPAASWGDDRAATTTVANTVAYRTTTVEFVIETPFTVPSDGVPHMVGVKNHSIPATFKHYATPKQDKDAFLYARTTGWEDLNLLPGEANVFFEGTYVGRSFLDLSRPQDTLNISLGRDKGVVVERDGRVVANLPCTGPLTSELGPDWFEQTGISGDDPGFDFPD